MGIVFQDNVLFNTSIRENIRLGNLNASDAEVESAAKAAEIHELIMSMPQGYDTVVGERGSRLSGGQRQRVAIARAIIRNPAILILDEATSALDPQTEAEINATLHRLAQRHTTVNVTHHLASTMKADRIYVIDQGALVESGTHSELLERGGLYAKLCQEQSDASIEGQPMGV
jgi:ATP-binding cassette subfamily B protein